jgi:hypothetical protein
MHPFSSLPQLMSLAAAPRSLGPAAQRVPSCPQARPALTHRQSNGTGESIRSCHHVHGCTTVARHLRPQDRPANATVSTACALNFSPSPEPVATTIGRRLLRRSPLVDRPPPWRTFHRSPVSNLGRLVSAHRNSGPFHFYFGLI